MSDEVIGIQDIPPELLPSERKVVTLSGPGSGPSDIDLSQIGQRRHIQLIKRPAGSTPLKSKKDLLDIGLDNFGGLQVDTAVHLDMNKLPQPIITLEEARLLGPQRWTPWPYAAGRFKAGELMTTVVGQAGKRRRFLISETIYEQLDKEPVGGVAKCQPKNASKKWSWADGSFQ